MGKPTAISAADWLAIRNAVATAVGQKSKTTQGREIAEHLLEKGWVDVEAVAYDVIPVPVPTGTQVVEPEPF